MSSQIELLYEIDEHDKDKSLSIIEMEKKVFCLREELQKREDILQEYEVLYNGFFISQVKYQITYFLVFVTIFYVIMTILGKAFLIQIA